MNLSLVSGEISGGTCTVSARGVNSKKDSTIVYRGSRVGGPRYVRTADVHEASADAFALFFLVYMYIYIYIKEEC